MRAQVAFRFSAWQKAILITTGQHDSAGPLGIPPTTRSKGPLLSSCVQGQPWPTPTQTNLTLSKTPIFFTYLSPSTRESHGNVKGLLANLRSWNNLAHENKPHMGMYFAQHLLSLVQFFSFHTTLPRTTAGSGSRWQVDLSAVLWGRFAGWGGEWEWGCCPTFS